jgi:hypothetical protein
MIQLSSCMWKIFWSAADPVPAGPYQFLDCSECDTRILCLAGPGRIWVVINLSCQGGSEFGVAPFFVSRAAIDRIQSDRIERSESTKSGVVA